MHVHWYVMPTRFMSTYERSLPTCPTEQDEGGVQETCGVGVEEVVVDQVLERLRRMVLGLRWLLHVRMSLHRLSEYATGEQVEE